jgi:hypothetical protein
MVSTLVVFAVSQAALAALLLAALLVHEVGHAAAGLSCGFRLRSIRIGLLRMSRNREHRWRVDFGIRPGGEVVALLRTVPGKWVRLQCIAFILGGPFANFFIAIVLWPLMPGSTAIANIAGVFACVSVILGLINLIPFRTRFGTSDGAKLLSLLANGAGKNDFIFRVSLFARIEEVQALRCTQPEEAVSKLKGLIREAEGIAKRKNKQDLAELAAKLEKMIVRRGEPREEATPSELEPSAGLSNHQQA